MLNNTVGVTICIQLMFSLLLHVTFRDTDTVPVTSSMLALLVLLGTN